jgi:hypothetical protein
MSEGLAEANADTADLTFAGRTSPASETNEAAKGQRASRLSPLSPYRRLASWSPKIRVQSSAIRAETEIAAIQTKPHHCSNPWLTNTNGRFPNPQWTLAVSHGHGHRKQDDSVALCVWRLAFGVWRFAFRVSRFALVPVPT